MVIYLKEDLTAEESLTANVIFWMALGLNVIFNLISCWALVDGFRRMVNLKEASKNLIVNYKMMTAHVVSYAIFILALAIYFFSLSGAGNSETNSALTDLVAICSAIS